MVKNVIVKLTGIIAVLAVLPLFPWSAYANPIIFLQGKVYLTKYGSLYDKPATITLDCSSFGPLVMSPSGQLQQQQQRQRESSFCHYICPIKTVYSDGPCDLTVKTTEGEFVITNFLEHSFITNLVSSSETPGIWTRFEAEVDIGTQTYSFGKPRNSTTQLSYGTLFWAAWLLALLIEVPILLMSRKYIFELGHLGIKKLAFVGGIASLATLFYVWYGLPAALPIPYIYYIGIAEILVVAVEAGIYTLFLGMKTRYAFPLSFLANTLSFLAGLLLL